MARKAGSAYARLPGEERLLEVWDHCLKESRYSGSLATGIVLLASLRGRGVRLGIAEVATMRGVGRSTVHRYFTTFVALGWLEQDRSHRYRFAPGSAALGIMAVHQIAVASGCEPVLRELRAQTGHTASLVLLDGSQATYVRRAPAHLRGQFEADDELGAGAHVPLHCTAAGKALLASLPEEELRKLLSGVRLKRHAPQTITAKKRLMQEIERVRGEGVVASSERELNGAECSLAAAVPGLLNWLGLELRFAVEVNAPASECSMSQLRRVAARPLADAAQRIGRVLQARSHHRPDG